MKQYKINKNGKEYHIFAKDEIAAVEKLKQSMGMKESLEDARTVKATELKAGDKIIVDGTIKGDIVLEVLHVEKYPNNVYTRVRENIDGRDVEYNVHINPARVYKLADKSVFSKETMNSVQEGIEKDYESMRKHISGMNDMALKDMPLMFRSNVNMNALRSNINNVAKDGSGISSLKANLEGILADIDEWKEYSQKSTKFDENESLRLMCKSLCDRYLNMLQNKDMLDNFDKQTRDLADKVINNLSAATYTLFETYKKASKDSKKVKDKLSSNYRIIETLPNGYGIAQTYGDDLFYIFKDDEVLYGSYAFLENAKEALNKYKKVKDSAIKDSFSVGEKVRFKGDYGGLIPGKIVKKLSEAEKREKAPGHFNPNAGDYYEIETESKHLGKSRYIIWERKIERDNAIKDSAIRDSERYLIRKNSGAGEVVYETNDLQDAIEELRALGKSYYIDDTQKDITIKYSQAIKDSERRLYTFTYKTKDGFTERFKCYAEDGEDARNQLQEWAAMHDEEPIKIITTDMVYDSAIRDAYNIIPGAIFKEINPREDYIRYIKITLVKNDRVTSNLIVKQGNQYKVIGTDETRKDLFIDRISGIYKQVSSLYDSAIRDAYYNIGDSKCKDAYFTKSDDSGIESRTIKTKLWNPDFYLVKEPNYNEVKEGIRQVLKESGLEAAEIELSVFKSYVAYSPTNKKLDNAQLKKVLNDLIKLINRNLYIDKLVCSYGQFKFTIEGFEYLIDKYNLRDSAIKDHIADDIRNKLRASRNVEEFQEAIKFFKQHEHELKSSSAVLGIYGIIADMKRKLNISNPAKDSAIKDESSSVREWYMRTYPSDKLGKEINPNLTWYDVYEAKFIYKVADMYRIIGVEDSVVRERIEAQLNRIKKDLEKNSINDAPLGQYYFVWYTSNSRDWEKAKKAAERAGVFVSQANTSKNLTFTGDKSGLEEVKTFIENYLADFRSCSDIRILDKKIEDYASPYAIYVKKNGKWLAWGGSNSGEVDRKEFLKQGYEDVKVVKNGS